MKDRHGYYQDERRDTLPGPGTRKRAHGDLGGQEMGSTNDGAKRAVIYLRVASAERGSPESVERQQQACREVAVRLGLRIVGVYQDVGTIDRSGLHQMLSEMGTLRPTSVITLDPSRFGRRYQDNMATMARLATMKVEPIFAGGAGEISLSDVRPAASGQLNLAREGAV